MGSKPWAKFFSTPRCVPGSGYLRLHLFYHNFWLPVLIHYIMLLTIRKQYTWFEKSAIKLIISLFLTANRAGLNVYIIPVLKVAHEHVLQTWIMPASFVYIHWCVYVCIYTEVFPVFWFVTRGSWPTCMCFMCVWKSYQVWGVWSWVYI